MKREIRRNSAKYESYKLAFRQIGKALKLGFPIEAIALQESIISDRLQSAAEGMGIPLRSVRPGHTADFSELSGLVEKRQEFKKLVEMLEEVGLSARMLVAWGRERNDFIHNVAHGTPRGAPAISASMFATQGAMIATTGLKLARIVCDWSKQELTGKTNAGKMTRTVYELRVNAPRGIDQSHCDFRSQFADPIVRSRLFPAELVDEFCGVYDSHGIAIPLKGSVLRAETNENSISIRLDDPRIGIAFYEDRTPSDTKRKLFYERAVWDDREWEMSELPDSKLQVSGTFDIRKLSIGIRLVPNLKGETEKLVSFILYGGRVIHAPYGQSIGRGMRSKFWILSKGEWSQMRDTKSPKELDEALPAGFFG